MLCLPDHFIGNGTDDQSLRSRQVVGGFVVLGLEPGDFLTEAEHVGERAGQLGSHVDVLILVHFGPHGLEDGLVHEPPDAWAGPEVEIVQVGSDEPQDEAHELL
jgi:hypothetical protein